MDQTKIWNDFQNDEEVGEMFSTLARVMSILRNRLRRVCVYLISAWAAVGWKAIW